MDQDSFADRYDEMIYSPTMRALYADSGYFNVGCWTEGVRDIPDACDNLVDEVAKAVPADAALIVDTGCGVGAATCRFAEHFPDATILAVNISHSQLLKARRRGVRTPIVMDATRLAIATGTADAVIALESAMHFDTRAAFLAEAYRVLRPGGVITLADMLFHDPEPTGRWLLPSGNEEVGLEQYAALLTRTGFGSVAVRDTKELCWLPFCNVLRTVYPGREQRVASLETSLSHYVLASARKP